MWIKSSKDFFYCLMCWDMYHVCMKSKMQIRKNMKNILWWLSDVAEQSMQICFLLQELDVVQQAETICCYQPLINEPDISSCLDARNRDGKTIVVPHPNRSVSLVDFHLKQVYSWDIDIYIVPGRAFTCDGKRIGRWWWRYDRLLSSQGDSFCIWVCFAEQIMEFLPDEPHDIPMDMVVFPA